MNEINDDYDSILMYCKLNFICQFLLKVHCMQGLADIIDSINTFMFLFCGFLLLKLRYLRKMTWCVVLCKTKFTWLHLKPKLDLFSYNPKSFLIWFKLTYCMSGFVFCFFTFVYGNMFIILFALTTFNSFILNTEFLPKVMKTNIFFSV